MNGSAITGLTGSNNEFFTDPATFFNSTGVSFTDAAGDSINIFGFFQPGSTDVTVGNNYGEISSKGFGVGVFTAAAVPEPATWAMMLGGFALGGMALRRKVSGIATLTA